MYSARSMRSRPLPLGLTITLGAIFVAVVPGVPSAHGQPAPAPAAAPAASKLVAETPDAMIALHAKRVADSKAESAQLASLALIAHLADDASEGVAEKALRDIASAATTPAEVKLEAAALARTLAADEGTKAGTEKARAAGIVTNLAIVGPFRDTGGGLDAHDGPEGKGAQQFTDPKASYAWGTVEVGWRPVPETFAHARGVPLDLFIHPRKESCSIVATKIKLDAAKPIVVRLAATGSARLVFDGVDVAKSDDVHREAKLDRLAAQIDATAGAHVVAAKVCSGALEDHGRVRLRITDAKHAPIPVQASSDLAGDNVPWGDKGLKVTKVATPLGRLLANKGTGETLLDGATVRELAGADDLKSPRAPGLLDALLQEKDLSADRMAMTGVISGSGANKSGRLHKARTLAQKHGDAAALAYIDRRLVELHLETDMPDWAIATQRGTKLDTKKDDEAVVLGARIHRALRVDALTLQTLRDLTAAFRAGPQKVSRALLDQLSGLARSHDVKTWVAVTEELARRGVRGDVLVDAMSTRGKDAVVKAAKDAFEGGMDDADEALSVARRVVDAGANDVAAQLYVATVKWAPNRSEAWAGVARALAAAPRDASDQQKVLVALRRARELAPGDAKYRAELALRMTSGKAAPSSPTHSSEERDDERWLTKTETILDRRRGVPANGAPDVADRELHWLRAVRMHADNRVSQLIQYAREIVIPPRTQGELFEPIPPEGDLTEILKARVHKKGGGVAFPVEEHNDGARPRIRWPELAAGDTVEVVIRQWTSTAVGGRGDAPFYFMDYAGAPASHPLLYNEVVVETLPGHPLYVDVLHDKSAPFKKIEKDERGMHVLQMIWDKPMVVAEEPLAPSLTEIAPVIIGSTFKTWADFRKWYQEAIRGFTEPDEEVRRIAADLTKNKKTREEKLRALFEFVADDIRYVNYVSGEWWLPNRPQQLLARREGDCDDKAILLITLLRSVGIEAQEVMVQTRLTGQPSVLQAKNVAVPMFDHGIAYLPGPPGSPPGSGMYLDATSPQSRLGPIPSMDARAMALRMDSGPAEIVQLPASSPDDHGSDVAWTVKVNPDGSAELTGEEKHSGDGAFYLRTNLSQAEARSQYVEDSMVSPWMSAVEVDKNIEFKGDLPQGQALVKYKAKSRNIARREGKDLVLSLSQSNTLGSQLAPLVDRTLPVLLPSYYAPSHQNRVSRIAAPPGYQWGELPPGGDANGGPFGKAHLEIARDPKDPHVLVVKRSVVFDMHLVPVEKYAAWRAWIQQIDALMHREVRLVPGGG